MKRLAGLKRFSNKRNELHSLQRKLLSSGDSRSEVEARFADLVQGNPPNQYLNHLLTNLEAAAIEFVVVLENEAGQTGHSKSIERLKEIALSYREYFQLLNRCLDRVVVQYPPFRLALKHLANVDRAFVRAIDSLSLEQIAELDL